MSNAAGGQAGAAQVPAEKAPLVSVRGLSQAFPMKVKGR